MRHRSTRRKSTVGRSRVRRSTTRLNSEVVHHEAGFATSGFKQLFGTRRGQRLVDRFSVAQEHHAICPRGEFRVVGHHDRRYPVVAGRQDHSHDRFTIDRIQRARWLVGEEQTALAHYGPCDGDSLAFAAGKLIRKVLGPVCRGLVPRAPPFPGTGPSSLRRRQVPEGSDTFSTAVRPASRLKSWKT